MRLERARTVRRAPTGSTDSGGPRSARLAALRRVRRRTARPFQNALDGGQGRGWDWAVGRGPRGLRGAIHCQATPATSFCSAAGRCPLPRADSACVQQDLSGFSNPWRGWSSALLCSLSLSLPLYLSSSRVGREDGDVDSKPSLSDAILGLEAGRNLPSSRPAHACPINSWHDNAVSAVRLAIGQPFAVS